MPSQWKKKEIERVKKEIKERLDRLCEQTGLNRHQVIQQQLAQIDTETSENDLERYVLLMSGLVHHTRFGGLTSSQVRKSTQLVESIILANGIGPGANQSSALYVEYKWVASQLRKQEGKHFSSAWDLALSISGSKEFPGGEVFAELMNGHRLLRLGHATEAASAYLKVLDHGGDAFFERAVLGRLMSLRLSGLFEEFLDSLERFKSDPRLSKSALAELEWHRICLDYYKTGNEKRILSSTRRGRSHYIAAYVLEASLWSRLSTGRQYTDKVTLVRSLRKNTALTIGSTQVHLLPFVEALEICYDTEIPLHIRKDALHKQLARMHMVQFADKVLLIWAAATTFLFRSKAHDLGKFALREYVDFSYRCSNYKNCDVLGFLRHNLPNQYEEFLAATSEPNKIFAA